MRKLFHPRLFAVSTMSLLIFILIATCVKGQETGWRVWVKTSPCSGRNDWITTARDNPTGGGNFYYLANVIFPGTNCTTTSCTFQEAATVANSLRSSGEFSKYCCHDYSVWENSQTGKRSVVLGKFGTAGFGWNIVKGDLCCEEAEALAGIPGACSGTTDNNQTAVQNTKCWPGSYAAWNPQSQKVECYCNPGLVWNSTRTACIEPNNPSTVTCWPGSYAAINPQTQKTECYCNPGLVWNSTKTACVDPQELVRAADCSVYPGSYAAWNAQTQRVECWCPTGKKWNDTKTACIDNVTTTTTQCWPGSYAAVNPQTNLTECYCNPGLVWNATKTACIDPQELARNTDCSAYPGSYAAWNAQTQKVECWCPTGKKWNSTMTACIDNLPSINNNNGGGGNNNWTLVSVTVNPPNPKETWTHNEWNYTAQSSSAHYSIYDGATQIDFNWTPPPQQINSNGFTVSLNVQAKTTGGQVIAAIIGVSGSGITSDTPNDDAHRNAYAYGNGSANAQQSVTFKPTANASEIEVKIGLQWAVTFTYKYKRAQ